MAKTTPNPQTITLQPFNAYLTGVRRNQQFATLITEFFVDYKLIKDLTRKIMLYLIKLDKKDNNWNLLNSNIIDLICERNGALQYTNTTLPSILIKINPFNHKIHI